MFKIGDIEIENQVVLAPMAGVCDVAFRTIVKQFGAGLIYAEMVSVNGIDHQNQKSLKMLEVDETEHPMSMQIFGSDLETFISAAKFINANCDCDIIDINMGCPVPKITKNEAGAKLLRDPEKVYKIVKAVVETVDKPVTVKMRAGWDDENVNAVEVARKIEQAGAKAVAIHARTAKQMYSGQANWEIIRQVKEAVNIPVIGNGDVTDYETAQKMLNETKCDAVMIGRAALGNPWVIYEISQKLAGNQDVQQPTVEEKMEMCYEHYKRLVKLKGEQIAIREMRKHTAWYTKGIRGATKLRNQIGQINSHQDLLDLINHIKELNG